MHSDDEVRILDLGGWSQNESYFTKGD